MNCAHQVHVDYATPLRLCEIVNPRVRVQNASIVDHDVESSRSIDGSRYEMVDRGLDRNVYGVCLSGTAAPFDLFDNALDRTNVQVAKEDRRPF